MTKAAIIPICLTVLLGTATLLPAQPASADASPGVGEAVQEAVRRQAARVTLRQKLQDAQAATQRNDLNTAAKMYDECWTLVESIGTGIPEERERTVAGLTAVRMTLARGAQKRGDLRGAKTHINDVLRVNPHDTAAIQFKQGNDKLINAQRGLIPSESVGQQIPIIQSNKVDAATFVQNAKVYYELGKLDEAQSELKKALAIDPDNTGAFYYSSLIEQQRARQAFRTRNVTSEQRMVEVVNDWNDSVSRDSLPVPNPMAHTNLIYTSTGRQTIMSKLDRIRLDNVGPWDNLPLSEVVRYLSEEARKRDPEKKGINFLIDPNQAAAPVYATSAGGFGGGPAAAPAIAQGPIDPNTGLPMQTGLVPSSEQVDINSISIRINPPLVDVRLADALNAIVTVADHPIKYSIEDYAVVFSLKGPETPRLYTRTFKVDPNTFYNGLESVGSLDFSTLLSSTGGGGGGGGGGIGGGGGASGQTGGALGIPRVIVAGGQSGGGGGGGGIGGGGGQNGQGIRFVTSQTNFTAVVQQAVIDFFRTVGVNVDPVLYPGKAVFFNDREGTLLVRATSDDLDLIEAAIQTLNVAPPEVNIKTKFVEVTQNDSRALGFDWYLGNFLMGNGAVSASGGTQPSLNGANGGTFPGSLTTIPTSIQNAGGVNDTTIPASGSDGFLTSGLRNTVNAPALGTFTGILTDPQFRVVIRALEQRDGADVLNDAQITTLSGRQAQIQAVDYKFIAVQNNVNQTATGGGGGATGGTTGGGNGAIGTTIVPQTTPFPLGPTLDVIPYVSADGYTIQLTLIPSVLEFLGYDDPGQFIVQAQSATGGGGAGSPLTAQLPLPHFRLRQVTTSAIVWDGQTIVIGGLISENVTRVKDKVPVLGDVPLLGRLFRSESNVSEKKNLVIFVTPTIIDPAGNRLHTDEDLPFAQKFIPKQRNVSSNP